MYIIRKFYLYFFGFLKFFKFKSAAISKNIFVICFFISQVFTPLAQANLMDGIKAFEEEKYDEAARILYPLRRVGAIVPLKYLEHMKTNNLVVINNDYADDFEPIPVDGLNLSNSFLQASLASIELKTNKKKGIKKFEPLILNGNVRAITLIEKGFESDKKIVSLFKNSKLKKIKNKEDFKEYLKFTKLGPVELSNGVDPSLLFSLNATNFKPEFNKAIENFKDKIQEYPNHIGNMAFQVGSLDKERLFWQFLALENGETSAILPMAQGCLSAVTLKHQGCGDGQIGFNQKEEEALSLFRYYASKLQKNSPEKSEELGEVFGQYGTLLGEGIGGKKDPVMERRSYKWAAKKGNLPAIHNFAYMLEMGQGGNKDLVKARRYYKMAADLGYLDAQLNYALMLQSGEGGDKDLTEARRYFKMAADRGKMMAQYNLARMAEDGEGGDVDSEESLENYKKSADQGLAEAQYALARRLEERGDLFEARRYYKMSADQGRAEAQTNYAGMAYSGAGGDKDLTEAFLYSEKAAKKGFAIAQHNIAVLLWHGLGCKENHALALKYLQKSVAQGYSEALVLMQQLKRALSKEDKETPIIEPSSKEIVPQKVAEDSAFIEEEKSLIQEEKLNLEENEILFHEQHIDLHNPKIFKIVKNIFDENLKKKNIFSSSKRLNIRDIKLNIEHNYSTNYMFNGQVFQPTLFESSHTFIRPGMLQHLKEMISSTPEKIDKLPNIAEGFITIHYEEDGISKHIIIDLKERFLSGKRFFAPKDLEFKKLKRIINTNQDMLDESQNKAIRKLASHKRGDFLARTMKEKLCQQILEGAWSNCLDSEAILLLRLIQKLPSFLDQMHEVSGKDSVINITGLVLGISSYRDCCFKCQQLIQGFQWAAKDILQNSMDERIKIDDNFGTLAITYGQARLKFNEGELEFLNSDVILKPGEHKLIRCRAKNRD